MRDADPVRVVIDHWLDFRDGNTTISAFYLTRLAAMKTRLVRCWAFGLLSKHTELSAGPAIRVWVPRLQPAYKGPSGWRSNLDKTPGNDYLLLAQKSVKSRPRQHL